jgi:hypothetical protein
MLELEADEYLKEALDMLFALTIGKRLIGRQTPAIISKNVISAAKGLIRKTNKVRQFFYTLPRMRISYSVPQNVLKSEEKTLILNKILNFLEAKPLLKSQISYHLNRKLKQRIWSQIIETGLPQSKMLTQKKILVPLN